MRSGEHPGAIVALLLPLLAVPPAAADPLGQLLERAAPGGPTAAEAVIVHGWIERGGTHPEVVVQLRAEPPARLVADPGITVGATPRDGLAWLISLPHHVFESGRAYFDDGAVVRLPFVAEDGHPIALQIDYAWCLTDLICLFGEAEVVVSTRAPDRTGS